MAVGETAAGVQYETCTVRPGSHRISLHWRDPENEPYGTLARLWRSLDSRGRRPVYLTNAGIFATDLTPLGLHVEEGRALRPLNRANGAGNFFLRPNGVFYVDRRGKAGVLDTESFRKAFPAPHAVRMATQSGPMLVIGRKINPRFIRNGESRYRRNGVGVRPDGTVVFAVTLTPVTLWAFAALFRDTLKADAALYLDGNGVDSMSRDRPSTAWFDEFVGIIAVEEAKTPQ